MRIRYVMGPCLAGALIASPASSVLAFTSPCAVLGSPFDPVPCPVLDAQHIAQEAPRVGVEQRTLDKYKDDVTQATNQVAATGQPGQSNQGAPQPGGDLSNGQAVSSISSTFSSVQGQVAQFYFGDGSSFSDGTIAGARPSNYTSAAKENSNADITATVFALAAKRQIEKDSKEVAQMASQAGGTQNVRQDMGFANKVRAMLVRELQLRSELQARLLEIRSKNAAFHLTSDQTPDNATGDLTGSSTGSTAVPPPNPSSSNSPVETALAAPDQATAQQEAASQAGASALAAARQAGGQSGGSDPTVSSSASMTGLTSAIGASSSDPSSSATSLMTAYDQASGDSADKLRQVGLRLNDDPAAFGINGSAAPVNATAIIGALAGATGN